MTIAGSFAIPRAVRLVAFDLDGTLVTHAYAHWCREAVRIYPHLGAGDVTLARVRRDFSAGDMFASLPTHGRDELVSAFWDRYDSQSAPRCRCLPGVRSALHRMKGAGLTIAIVTARLETAECLMPRLQRWRLDRLCDFLLTCLTPDGICYTSKQPVLTRLLQMADVSGAQALMVGDTPADVEAARLAGYAIQVAVCSGGVAPSVLAAANPTSILRTASSLGSP